MTPSKEVGLRLRETVVLLCGNVTGKFTDEKASLFLALLHAETVTAAGWKQKLVSGYACIQK